MSGTDPMYTFEPGRVEPAQLDDETCGIAVRAARACGLDYTGVDLVESDSGPVVIE